MKSNKIPTLNGYWKSFEGGIISPKAGRDQHREMKRSFFMGCDAVYNGIFLNYIAAFVAAIEMGGA